MLKPILLIVVFGLLSIPILSLLMVVFELTPTQLKILAVINWILIYGLFIAPVMDGITAKRLEEIEKKEANREKE